MLLHVWHPEPSRKAALAMQLNKTDANDAVGLVQICASAGIAR